jgi:uncharacterized protein involved in exopolysaccharide biosynthesis
MEQNNALKLSDVFLLVKKFFNFYKSFKSINYIIIISFTTTCLLFYIIEKPKYEANASFVLMEGSGSKGGGLASLGSQFGIDIGSLGGQSNSIFTGDNIYDIFKSKTIVEKVLLSEFNDEIKGDEKKTFADAYLKMYPSFVNSVILGNKSPSVNYYGYDNNLKADRIKDSVLSKIFEKVIKNNLLVQKSNKKGSIIQVKITTNNELFSKRFAEKLIEEVKTFYLNINNTNTQIVLLSLQQKADSLQGLLYQKSLQSSRLFNANNGLNSYMATEEITQKDKTVTYALYSEVIKNIELTKMSQAQQTPIFQIVETPRMPLENKKLEFYELFFIGLLGGIAFSFCYAVLKYIFI